VANVFLLKLRVVFGPVAEHHVIDALEGISADGGVLDDDVEILPERAFPVLLAEVRAIEAFIDERDQWICFRRHCLTLQTKLKPARSFRQLENAVPERAASTTSPIHSIGKCGTF